MTLTANESSEIGHDDPLHGILFVDTDCHFTEPPDLWSARIPATSRARVPKQKTVDGHTDWYMDDEQFAGLGGNVLRRDGKRMHGISSVQPFAELHESTWSVPARLELMDSIGCLAEVIYPNGLGFSSNYMFTLDNLAERAVILQTYNDFCVDIQEESGGRLLPQCMVPVWDMDFTVKEMTRLIDKKITGFLLSDKPELLGLPEPIDPYFDPMWDVLNESGTVVSHHIASSVTKEEHEELRAIQSGLGAKPDQTMRRNPAPGFASLPMLRQSIAPVPYLAMANARIISNLIVSDLFDRFPRLKFFSAETGIGWVPYMLKQLEYFFDDWVRDDTELRYAKRRPSEYFRDNLYVSFYFEDDVGHVISKIGEKNIMVETDFPHPSCLYPNTRNLLGQSLVGVDPAARARILRDNAAEAWGIDVPALEGLLHT
jgi:uncharacterized protein